MQQSDYSPNIWFFERQSTLHPLHPRIKTKNLMHKSHYHTNKILLEGFQLNTQVLHWRGCVVHHNLQPIEWSPYQDNSQDEVDLEFLTLFPKVLPKPQATAAASTSPTNDRMSFFTLQSARNSIPLHEPESDRYSFFTPHTKEPQYVFGGKLVNRFSPEGTIYHCRNSCSNIILSSM